jgi:hypothetical protein
MISAAIAFATESKSFAYWTLWPYATASAAIGLGFALLRVDATAPRALAFATGGVLLAIVPSAHTLASSDHHHAFLNWGTVLGTGLIVLAFRQTVISANGGLKLVTILVGLVSVCVTPGLKALEKLGDPRSQGGDALVGEVIHMTDPGQLLAHPLFYLSYASGTSVVLVALGILFARDSEEKWPYRLLELTGLFLYFGLLTILSLSDWRGLVYPAALFGGGIAALAVGAHQRHFVLVLLPAVFLIINTWIQYFAKLYAIDFPLGLALIGFGIGILGGGVLFEKKVRPFLPELKSWA